MSKVLIIEDDPLMSRMYKQVFTFEGFEVVIAIDGLKGLELAKTEKPDIIFCDVMMPKMNGLEILENLKSDPLTQLIPVVMLTNLSGTQDSKEAMEKGAYAYIVKSEFKPIEIAQKAKDFLLHPQPKTSSS